jgi:hypothetical protein
MSSTHGADADESTYYYLAARAFLIYAHSIVEASTPEERSQMFKAACEANDTTEHNVTDRMSRLVSSFQYFLQSAQSVRWTASNAGFRNVIDGAYAIKCVRLDSATKNRARGKFKCTLCGQEEWNCNYAVHLAGSPPIVRDASLPKYSASAFKTSDLEGLACAYSQYAHGYNYATASMADDAVEEKWPVAPYLGVVLPGETCMARLLTAFSVQDFVRSVLDDVSVYKKQSSSAFPYERLDERRIQRLASRIDQQFECARGRAKPNCEDPKDSEIFWTEILNRFENGTASDRAAGTDATIGFLRAGYERMEHNVSKSGFCVDCADSDDDEEPEEDEEDETRHRSPARASSRKRKRRVVNDSDEEGDECDQSSRVDDDDIVRLSEDPLDNTVGLGSSSRDPSSQRRRPQTQAWGATPASRAGPFAQPRRPVEEPFVPTATRSARRRATTTLTLADSEQTTDPILLALRTVSKDTARGLRAHPNNAIGSRRSTLLKLNQLVTSTMKDGDLTMATGLLQALATLTKTLNLHEQGCETDGATKARHLSEVANDRLTPLYRHFCGAGMASEARSIAEAIIVTHELLA